METETKPRVPWLFLSAALGLLVLLVLPATGWVARSQVGMLFHRPTALVSLLRDLGVKELPGVDLNGPTLPPVSALAGDDYPSQLAAALAYTQDTRTDAIGAAEARIQRVRNLTERFPAHRAALLAHCLRYATQSLVHTHRDGEVETYMSGKPFKGSDDGKTSPPEALAAFDQDAQAGETLDPTNAYFPLMRAIGLFAARRDAEGLDAIQRAAACPRFEDYALDEADAAWQRLEAQQGRQSVQMRSAVYAALLLPHYAQIRATARLTAYKAVQSEVAGNAEEGLAIRHAMMRCGGLMLAQSHSGIGSLVGIAVFALQSVRPGGEKFGGMSEAAWKALDSEERSQRRLKTYTDYVTRLKHPAEAEWARKEDAAARESLALMRQGQGAEKSPFGVPQTSRLFGRWILSMVLLTNALEMLALCGAMLLLRAARRDSGRTPFIVAGGLCLLFVALACRSEWLAALTGLRQVVANLSESKAGPAQPFVSTAMMQLLAEPFWSRVVISGLSLCAPLLSLAALGFAQFARRKPQPAAWVHGLCGGGVIVCLALVLAYSVALFGTAQEERRQDQALQRLSQHEGRYDADLLGKPWPALPADVGRLYKEKAD